MCRNGFYFIIDNLKIYKLGDAKCEKLLQSSSLAGRGRRRIV
jgi:hypothetical protein